ncbi:transcriptional regulator with XRE-family HTH domain [Paenibacillus sp. DS2015]|uniref:helix-turn-helix transcriptional regulator n=1 Tax=Paenibacillus sp. DS2015 TaxID=3373917 RepID=UPI003D22B404
MGMLIKSNVDKLLESKGWTLYRLSKESKVSMTVIYNLGSREHGPTAETLIKIADALGVKVDALLR